MNKNKASVGRTVLIVLLCLLLIGGVVGLTVRIFGRGSSPKPEEPSVAAENVELDKSEIVF